MTKPTAGELKVDVRSPHPGELIRVNPDPEYRLEAMLIREGGETYMVAANIVEQIAPERMTRKTLFIAQNVEGETFMWPVSAPVAKDHLAYRAMDEWICFPALH